MSDPREVPPTAAEPAPSRRLRDYPWGKIAETCGGLGMVLVLAWGFFFKLDWAERVSNVVVMAPLILLCILTLLPSFQCTGHYPPLAPPRPGSSWLVYPPGVTSAQ